MLDRGLNSEPLFLKVQSQIKGLQAAFRSEHWNQSRGGEIGGGVFGVR